LFKKIKEVVLSFSNKYYIDFLVPSCGTTCVYHHTTFVILVKMEKSLKFFERDVFIW